MDENPYESAKVPSDARATDLPKERPNISAKFAGLIGAAIGFVLLELLQSPDHGPIFALRSSVTGEETINEIIAHPADFWVIVALYVGFILSGGLIARQLAIFTMRSRQTS